MGMETGLCLVFLSWPKLAVLTSSENLAILLINQNYLKCDSAISAEIFEADMASTAISLHSRHICSLLLTVKILIHMLIVFTCLCIF